MRTFPIDEGAAWYRGSPLELYEFAPGSTIAQWKELAEAFSRKPTCLQYDEIYGTIHIPAPRWMKALNGSPINH